MVESGSSAMDRDNVFYLSTAKDLIISSCHISKIRPQALLVHAFLWPREPPYTPLINCKQSALSSLFPTSQGPPPFLPLPPSLPQTKKKLLGNLERVRENWCLILNAIDSWISRSLELWASPL